MKFLTKYFNFQISKIIMRSKETHRMWKIVDFNDDDGYDALKVMMSTTMP
jgi:hypothetical protein